MFYNDLVTHTRWLASFPYPTSFPYPHFETANNSSQCFISELCIEGCRPIADVSFQLNIALFVLNALVLTAVAAPAILCRFSGGQISDDVSGNHVGSLARAHKNTGVAAAPVQDHAQPPDPALTETSAAASVSKRGKSKIVGGVASGSSSNSAQARAQIASGSTEADTDLPEATRESQPDESSEITTGEVTTPEDTTQNASGSGRGVSNPLHQSPLPPGDGSIFGFLQSGLYRSVVYLVGQFTTHAIRYQLIPRLGNHPLLNSLYGRDSVLSIFAIAEDEFKGDVEALHRAIRETHGGNIRFATFRRDISPDSFRAEIKRLHDDCRKLPDTHLFIYLTGHGNNSNKMIIPESKTISETDLFELLSTTESTIMITILFDICRRARIPSAVPPTGISLIWACSLGETAGACGGPDYDGPNSCFLNALMMSAHTPNLQYTSEGLKSTIQERLDQLMDYLEEVYTTGHPMGRCAKCSGTPEPCDKPRRQNIDWSGAENMNGLLELTKILSSSKFAEEVYRQFMGDDTFLTVNKLSDPRILRSVDILDEGDALAASHIPDENTHKRGRGANDPVHAGKPQGEGVRVTLARRLDGIKDSTQTSFFIDPAGSITVNTVEAAVGGYY